MPGKFAFLVMLLAGAGQIAWAQSPVKPGDPPPVTAPPPRPMNSPPPIPPRSDPLRPIMATHRIPPYPRLAIALEEQGRSLLEVHITTEGAVDDCKIVQSSDSQSLDQAGCDYVQQVWRWQPPTKDGQPVGVWTRIQIVWDLKTDALPPDHRPRLMVQSLRYPPYPSDAQGEGTTMMRTHVTAQGTADDCKVVQSSGSPRLDQAACDHAKMAWRWYPAVAQGQTVEGTALASITWANGRASGTRLTGARLVSACASPEKDVNERWCDAPVNALYEAAQCTSPSAQDGEKNRANLRDKLLAWLRAHPEAQQKEIGEASRAAFQEISVCK